MAQFYVGDDVEVIDTQDTGKVTRVFVRMVEVDVDGKGKFTYRPNELEKV